MGLGQWFRLPLPKGSGLWRNKNSKIARWSREKVNYQLTEAVYRQAIVRFLPIAFRVQLEKTLIPFRVRPKRGAAAT
jgi:hypothetical protein